MTNKITNIIVDYDSRNYTVDSTFARTLHQQLLEYLKEEVGCYTVVAKDSQAEIVVKVTKSFNRFAKETYSAWKDDLQGDFLGRIEIDIIKPDEEGMLCSPFRPSTNWSYWKEYAWRAPKGTIIIDDLKSDTSGNHYKGVGTGLFQIAVEVSKFQGCAYKIAFDSVNNSPGFYRKMQCSSDDKGRNKEIDKAVEKAKKENIAPDTHYHTGYMYLGKHGAAYWEKITTQSPILYPLKKTTIS